MYTDHVFFSHMDHNEQYPHNVFEPEYCPMCKRAIHPVSLADFYLPENAPEKRCVILFLCPACNHPFIATYKNLIREPELLAPKSFKTRSFDEKISCLSPKFVEVYNQALRAETEGMDELAGMGYRKALEFLIKDYLISLEPEQSETIRGMSLANCISNKLTNERLKAVSSRAAWLGNDFTHYDRKFDEYEISDLKRFIDSAIYWILSELTVEEALAIDRR